MNKQVKKENFFLAAVFVCLGVSIFFLAAKKQMTADLAGENGMNMILETAFFFCWMLFFSCKVDSRRLSLAGMGLWSLATLWLHQVLWPFLVSGIWVAALILLGDCFLGWLWKTGFRKKTISIITRMAAGFVLGGSLWISLVCLLSAFGYGGLSLYRMLAAVLAVGMGALYLPGWIKKWQKAQREQKPRKCFAGVLVSVMLTMLMIQLCRINLTPDYDSLHYGLRSPYILDSGKGIYEDLGNINLVYTYPKGFEVLTFPLSGTVTYAYQLCFNLWMCILVLLLTYELTRTIDKDRSLMAGLGGAALVSMIPGVMNMGITAKSDLVTLVSQLFFILVCLNLIQDKKQPLPAIAWFSLGLGTCLFSFALKPTALIFTTVTALFSLFWLGKRNYLPGPAGFAGIRWILGVLPCGAALAGIWARTLIMTGVPTTSVFTPIWSLFGFQVKWPYAFFGVPDQGISMGLLDGLNLFAARLFGVLLAPVSEDMSHVIIAWGTELVVLALLVLALWGGYSRKKHKFLQTGGGRAGERLGFLFYLGIVLGVLSLCSLFLLWQVDGNYFMLLYVLLMVLAGWVLADRDVPGRLMKRIKIPALLAGAVLVVFHTGLTLTTNWAGTVGFTPPKLKSQGVFNHQQLNYEQACQNGYGAIWGELAQNPAGRVIAFGFHPEVLSLPCNVQSYYDVTGSGGNVVLVKTLDNFKQFLAFAKTEYLFVQAGYLEAGSRAYDVVYYLIEEGSLGDIRYENGNLIAKINTDHQLLVDSQQEIRAFEQNIVLKDQP